MKTLVLSTIACTLLSLPAPLVQAAQPAAAVQTQSGETRVININTATLEELTQLPGVGESKAKAIIAYREQAGGFLEVEQLTEVRGIGDKLLAKIRDHIDIH
ncbi:ComEA family DNA-binding protein [Alteromonas sp. CYL-A6]|uniref:ComEA family DNA-binding protein n=1 Tax=Alteromonas nitratireducens TaxID=3390813 RepID=UPI0034BB28FB